MLRVAASNIHGVFSITIVRQTLSAMVILFLLCVCIKDQSVFAQTAETQQGSIYDEIIGLSAAEQIGEPPSAEAAGQDEPRLIDQTVEPVTESWGRTEGFGEKIDWIHYKLYEIAQAQVERFDSLFKPPPGEQSIAEPSRFRVGLYGEGKIREYRDTEVDPVADFDAEIDLPKLKRKIKLIITTTDPTTIPGRSFIEQQDKSLRTSIVRQWLPEFSTAAGVRLRWKPEIFAYALWTYDWKAGNWRIYPQQKIYWENEKGFGEISTMVLDHWTGRWNTRFSSSIKWSRQDRDVDQKTGRQDGGFRWSEVFLLEFVKELLDESQLGRKISGDDIARGWGLRVSAFGGFHFSDEYRAGIFYRRPLRSKWVYAFAGPEIKWRNDNDWAREWTLKCGIEMLFWGGRER